MLAAGKLQGLGHQADDVGLADRLAAVDRQRPVGVGLARQIAGATNRSRGTRPMAASTRSIVNPPRRNCLRSICCLASWGSRGVMVGEGLTGSC